MLRLFPGERVTALLQTCSAEYFPLLFLCLSIAQLMPMWVRICITHCCDAERTKQALPNLRSTARARVAMSMIKSATDFVLILFSQDEAASLNTPCPAAKPTADSAVTTVPWHQVVVRPETILLLESAIVLTLCCQYLYFPAHFCSHTHTPV